MRNHSFCPSYSSPIRRNHLRVGSGIFVACCYPNLVGDCSGSREGSFVAAKTASIATSVAIAISMAAVISMAIAKVAETTR